MFFSSSIKYIFFWMSVPSSVMAFIAKSFKCSAWVGPRTPICFSRALSTRILNLKSFSTESKKKQKRNKILKKVKTNLFFLIVQQWSKIMGHQKKDAWKLKTKHTYLFQYKLLYRNETGTKHHGLLSTSVWCFKIFLRGSCTWGVSV